LHSTRSLGVEAGLSLLLVLVHLRYRSMLTVAGEPWRRLSDHRSDGDLGEAFAAAFHDHDWPYESVLQLPARMHPGEPALAIDHLDALHGTRTDDRVSTPSSWLPRGDFA